MTLVMEKNGLYFNQHQPKLRNVSTIMKKLTQIMDQSLHRYLKRTGKHAHG